MRRGSASTSRPSWAGIEVFTIGHSTRTIDELVAMLRSFAITRVVDVRTIPRSGHNPQFDGRALRESLRRRGIGYVHLPKLGGLRRPREGSPNTAWRSASFRGFADYLQTQELEEGLAELHALASEERVALMCAEAVPWRCHRSLLGDVLVARGAQVEHVMGVSRSSPHRMTSFARVDGGRVTYPAPEGRAHDACSTSIPAARRA